VSLFWAKNRREGEKREKGVRKKRERETGGGEETIFLKCFFFYSVSSESKYQKQNGLIEKRLFTFPF